MERIRGIAIKTLTILAGFWLADLAAARIQAGIAAGESMKRIMDGMTTMLQHPNALGFDRTSLLCGLGGACAVGLFHLYRWSMRRNWRDGEGQPAGPPAGRWPHTPTAIPGRTSR